MKYPMKTQSKPVSKPRNTERNIPANIHKNALVSVENHKHSVLKGSFNQADAHFGDWRLL